MHLPIINLSAKQGFDARVAIVRGSETAGLDVQVGSFTVLPVLMEKSRFRRAYIIIELIVDDCEISSASASTC